MGKLRAGLRLRNDDRPAGRPHVPLVAILELKDGAYVCQREGVVYAEKHRSLFCPVAAFITRRIVSVTRGRHRWLCARPGRAAWAHCTLVSPHASPHCSSRGVCGTECGLHSAKHIDTDRTALTP